MFANTEIQLDDKNKIVVEETVLPEKYGGDHGVSIRKFYHKNGMWNPSKSGIFLSLTKATEIEIDGQAVEISHFDAVVDAALGLLSELKGKEGGD
jgi:hypothetical protein